MTRVNKLNSPYCRVARKNPEIHVILFILVAIITDVLAFVSDFSLYRVLTHFNKSCLATYFNNQILVSYLFYLVNCCDLTLTPPCINVMNFESRRYCHK